MGEVNLTETLVALVEETRKVHDGDLRGAEAMLTAQAVALNAMFTQLALQTSKMQIVDQIDRFTRLALKAQGQCRTTLETLAVIKNPPVFARQANIAHGPQQVNNGLPPGAHAGAGNQKSEPNKLLEAHGERVDLRASEAAGCGDLAVAAVGTINRASHG